MKKRLVLLLLLCMVLGGCRYEIVPELTRPPGSDGLTVHYIDVGQADAMLLECHGRYMLIDGGNKEDSQLVVAYLQQQGVEELAAVVCTHPHEDHAGGLPAVLAVYPVHVVYAPTRTYASQVYDEFLYYADQQRLEVTIPEPGDQWALGEARVTVLGPVKSYAEVNDTSIILLVEYGKTRFLFTGDMENEAERDMIAYWDGKLDWDVDVLKVGHHGSDTSSSYRFIYETQPEYGIVSVGWDNPYGHPDSGIMKRYADAGTVAFRTDRLGTVIARSDGKTVTLTWENRKAEPENALPAGSIVFIGNVNSGAFHRSDCVALPKESNRIYFESYLDALEAGYSPCGNCLNG